MRCHLSSSRAILVKTLALILCGLALPSLHADDWPQFRGPNCSGVSSTTAPLPDTFSATERVAWSVPLGDGIGSPVIVAGRVFVSEMVDPQTLALSAFEARTGKPIWKRTWPVGDVDEIHLTNSHAGTTVAADADQVYFYFSTLGLVALNAQTGTDVWKRELPVPYFIFKWGPGMSPVLYKDLVLFCQDDDLHPALHAFDRATGATRWVDDRNDMAVNYSHPVVCSTPTGDEIVVAGTGLLIGYDPATGSRLWTARTLLRNLKTTPVVHNGVIYVSLQSRGIASQWLTAIDRGKTGNSDNKVSRAETQAYFGQRPVPEAFYRKTFDRGDLNKDGVLEGAEIDFAFLPPGNQAGATFDRENSEDEFILAVRGGGRGDVTATHLLWKHPTRHTDHVVSPLVSQGRMFLVKAGGIATCFETATGKPVFGPARINNAGDYFASPIVGDGTIYIAGENGNVVVLRDAPSLEVLAVNDLGESIVGTPAIADGALFFRTRRALFRIQ